MHNPESDLENETHKPLSDFEMQTDHLISTIRPDLVRVNKKKKKENMPNKGQGKAERKRKEKKIDAKTFNICLYF